MRVSLTFAGVFLLSLMAHSQSPIPFACSGNDGFGYYISSATSTTQSGVLRISDSRLSRLTTATGDRTTVCTAAQLDISLNALAFNPQDNFLYAVSRFDSSQFSGRLYRIGANCARQAITVNGIRQFGTNNAQTVDNNGGAIGSGTFDLEGNYYVNTSYALTNSTGFRNRIQKINISSGTTATVESTATLTCPSCQDAGDNKLTITDIIFDETTGTLYGSNRQRNALYRINSATGVITPVGATGITNTILGLYKNRFGAVRAIDSEGIIYSVNLSTGAFTQLSVANDIRSGNADAASGCYAPAVLSGNVFVDANGLTDGTVNGTGTGVAGTVPLFATLIQLNSVVASVAVNSDGTYAFEGDFEGDHQVRIGRNQGTKGAATPTQSLPGTHVFTGDNIGTAAGSDGSPNGRLSFTLALGDNLSDINFGINTKPTAEDVDGDPQTNPGGTSRVQVPTLVVADAEDGTPTTIRITQIPDATTEGVLYYNGSRINSARNVSNYQPELLQFDPVDGQIVIDFLYAARDRANTQSNQATVTMDFSSTLPILLVHFSAAYERQAVRVDWETATEFDTDYFIVQRRAAAGEFSQIGRVQATGYSNELLRYSLLDQQPLPEAYYRLVDVDFDGTTTYSSAVYVTSEQADLPQLYPSPVVDQLTITYTSRKPGPLTANFYSVSGRLLLTKQLTATRQTLPLGGLPAGLYSVVITDGQGSRISTHRVMKR
ncbi:DUF6923 family protein [Neolewinella sp.]|uniref:DUF6923 family protein n=1 Tax=Neolewinella sp. TaxID=2993543 RepID=UPI003B51E364